MIRNYLKIAWRNLMKNKVFSFINIFGLSIGLTCCMLISLYIYNETNYDTYHKNGDRVYLLGTDFMMEGKSDPGGNSSAPLGKTMQMDFPEIEDQTRMVPLFSDDKTLIQYEAPSGDKKAFYETKGYVADSNLFKILTYNFVQGNAATALMEPNTVVLMEDIARKLFGSESAINKMVHISSSTNGDHDYKVTGVYRPYDIPTHVEARFIMSMRGGSLDRMANDNPSLIYNNMFATYVLLRKGTDAKKLAAKFPDFVRRHVTAEQRKVGWDRNYLLTPLKDVYLANLSHSPTHGGSRTSLYILGSIAVLTLLIACINFMNLSTSSSSKRAAEVGVRKVLGAEKRTLLWQFLGESLMMSGIALLFAILFTQLMFPVFEKISGKTIGVSFQQHSLLFAGFVLLAIVTGLLAGSYPAFYLSAFKPIQVLKGKFKNSLAAVSVRKGMVVFQFVISIALIVASIIIARQMQFMRNKDLGFDKEQQIVVPLRTGTAKNGYAALKSELLRVPGVQSAGASFYYPGIFNPTDWLMFREGTTKEQSKDVFINFVDVDFGKTLGLQAKEGRLFTPEYFVADTVDGVLVNEQTIKSFGFASDKDAVGKWIGFQPGDSLYKLRIVGVVKDFHFKDFHSAIEPYAFLLNSNNQGYNYLIVKAKGKDMSSTLNAVEATWHKQNANEPFEYSFLDQDFEKNFEAENRQGGLIKSFTIVAIIISCLGLFALAAFSAEQRTKEIGVRKVLGASVAGIVTLLSKDFLKLVGVAILIACPVAWYMMNKWLQSFAYRTPVSWHVFALTAFLAIGIAILTISFQAVKAALSNPVRSLRTE